MIVYLMHGDPIKLVKDIADNEHGVTGMREDGKIITIPMHNIAYIVTAATALR